MLVRPVATAVAAVAAVTLPRDTRTRKSHEGSVEFHRPWYKTTCVSCQASTAIVKRDFFIFQNPHGIQDYAYKGLLGDGGFSIVNLSIHKRTGQPRAIKKISKKASNQEEFEAELRALISLDHPHIVKVLEYWESSAHFHVVLELCTGKDLFAHLVDSLQARKEIKVLEREASIIMRQCVKAVVGVHCEGFIHRDLKPENFLLAGKDSTVKLIDFGLAARCGDGQHTKGVVGTYAYMAPEMILDSKEYDKAVDVWSLGVVLFMMLALQAFLPDGEEKNLLRDETYVKKRLLCDELAECSADVKDLLHKMLEWDPEKRITTSEILQHPFIVGRGCEQLCDSSRFDWQFDRALPSKMERYAKSPLLRQIGLRCLVHLAEAAALPDKLVNELLTARHHFRSLNSDGTGHVFEHQLRRRLEQERIPIPNNFSEICKACQHGPEAVLDYGVLVACLLIDATWPDALLREVFNILDRSRDGVIEIDDLVELARAEHPQGFEAIFREADPEGKGYINYDTFMKIMQVNQTVFQWFEPARES